MNYEGVLKFKGTWRSYQARVLEHVGKYLADGKIHIVAAPGSGKTTLGIELIRRMNGNALILAPSITIREQWVARIREAFLCDGSEKSQGNHCGNLSGASQCDDTFSGYGESRRG